MTMRTSTLVFPMLALCVSVRCTSDIDQQNDSPSTSPTPLSGRFTSVSHPTASCACNGDISPLAGDGRMDSSDTTQLDLCVLAGGGLSACDVNCDGQFNIADLDVMTCIGLQRGQNCCAATGACVRQDGTCADDKVLTCAGCNTHDICPVRDGATYHGGQSCANIAANAPQNDRCENAAPLTTGSLEIDTRGSFALATESNCSAAPIFHDVWYSYQSRTTGRVTIETCAVDADMEAVISVFSSFPMSSGRFICPEFDQTPVACSAPGCASSENGATAEFLSRAGQFYLIQIGAKLPESQGVFQLTVTEEPSLTCGDGLLQFPESCDDGNKNDGDGCDSSCVAESIGGTSCTTTLDCLNAPENNACNCVSCVSGTCTYTCIRFGSADCSPLFCLDDILCTLAGFGNPANCPNADNHPCDADGDIDIEDILQTLVAFARGNPCGCTNNAAPGTGVPPECGFP